MEQPYNSSVSAELPLTTHILVRVLRIFFKLLYHQFAWTYDWVAATVSLGSWRSWVEASVPYLDDSMCLEIGTGPGHLQLTLHQKGVRVFGLDESPQMIRMTHKLLSISGQCSNLVRGLAERLPFSDGSFRQVVMTFPAEFALKQAALREIYRIITPNGKVVVLPMAWITGRKPLQRAVAWINHITGEAPEWDERFLDPLTEIGFTTKWEMIHFSSSEVLLITLEKPSIIPQVDRSE